MARIYTNGFESGAPPGATSNYDPDGDVAPATPVVMTAVGAPTVQNTTARNGGFALSAAAGGGNYIQSVNSVIPYTIETSIFVRFYLRITGNLTPSGTTNNQVYAFRTNSANVIVLDVQSGGALRVHDNAVGNVGSTAQLALDTWHLVELRMLVNSAGGGEVDVRLDGNTFVSATGVSMGNSAASPVHRFGHVNAAETAQGVFIDDIGINNTTGSDQNTWIGEGGITLLKPVADNFKGTGWEGPQTTGSDTTNLYDNVDNTPPLGVAHADTDANAGKYIFNAANLGAASDYRADCQTPLAAGVPAGSVIKLSQVHMRGSVNSTTGTNNADIQGINPATSAQTCNIETTAVAGTEPTGWKSFRTPVLYNPAFALTDTPTVEVTKTLTGATRAHMVSQLGLLVEWGPGSAPQPPSVMMAPRIPPPKADRP